MSYFLLSRKGLLILCDLLRMVPHFNSVFVLVSEAAPSESDQMLGEVDTLSVELKHYIQEDNWRFEQEVEEWEEEQSCKIPQMESSTSSASQDFSPSPGTWGACVPMVWQRPPCPPQPALGLELSEGSHSVHSVYSSGVVVFCNPAE